MKKSRKWIEERKRDAFYRKAKREGYRSRAVYKLKEIDKKFRILRKGQTVIDLGAAPGGWLQYVAETIGNKGTVIGVDIKEIAPLPYENVKTLKADVFQENIEKQILKLLGSKADVILSDLSPKISGVWEVDVARSVAMCERVVELSRKLLKKNGRLIMKIFEGMDTKRILSLLERNFSFIKLFKPAASRKKSSELYIICLGYRKFSDDF